MAERHESKLKTGVPDIYYSVGSSDGDPLTHEGFFLSMSGWLEVKFISELGSQFERFLSGLEAHQALKLIDYNRAGIAAHMLLGVGSLWLLIPARAECVKYWEQPLAYQDYADQADACGSINDEGGKALYDALRRLHEIRIEATMRSILLARQKEAANA